MFFVIKMVMTLLYSDCQQNLPTVESPFRNAQLSISTYNNSAEIDYDTTNDLPSIVKKKQKCKKLRTIYLKIMPI